MYIRTLRPMTVNRKNVTLKLSEAKTASGSLRDLQVSVGTVRGDHWIEKEGPTPDELVTLTEIDYVVTPGLDLKLMYEFNDPDVDLKTGSTSRYTVGFEFFPITGVEVRPLYRIWKESQNEVKNNEFLLMIHFFP